MVIFGIVAQIKFITWVQIENIVRNLPNIFNLVINSDGKPRLVQFDQFSRAAQSG